MVVISGQGHHTKIFRFSGVSKLQKPEKRKTCVVVVETLVTRLLSSCRYQKAHHTKIFRFLGVFKLEKPDKRKIFALKTLRGGRFKCRCRIVSQEAIMNS